MKQRNWGPGFLFLAALFWSLAGLFTKSVVWDGVSVAVARSIVGLIIICVTKRPFPIRLNLVKILTAICYFAQGLLFIVALKLTTAANVTTLQYTSTIHIIVFTAIMTRVLPRKRDVITALIMLSGIVLAFAGNMQGGGMLGNILALLSGVFYAGVFFCSRMKGADAMESIVLGNGIYLLLLPWVFMSESVRSAPTSDLIYVVLFGICGAGIAWMCFAKGIKTTEPLQSNFITMLEPVMAPIWTFLFLGESITIFSLLGCGIVIATLLTYEWLEHKYPI